MLWLLNKGLAVVQQGEQEMPSVQVHVWRLQHCLGTLLGGALGRGAQQAFLNDSPAAEYLAKMQTGELNAQEKYELENILGDTYKSIIGA